MPKSTLALPFVTVPIYSLALALGIALGVGIGIRRMAQRPGAVVDACLGALAGGIVGARIGHVLLNWSYFADNLSEALRPGAGGVDWHGALLGGLIGLALVARWHRLSLRDLLDALAPTLPLLALAGWLGCWAAVCGYGAEVDTLARYPALAAETRDVYGIVAPRYSTQVFGMALALGLFALSAVLIRRGWLKYRRFWLLLALLSAGMVGIGFLRGDSAPVIAGLRADQWLDGGTLVISFWFLARTKRA